MSASKRARVGGSIWRRVAAAASRRATDAAAVPERLGDVADALEGFGMLPGQQPDAEAQRAAQAEAGPGATLYDAMLAAARAPAVVVEPARLDSVAGAAMRPFTEFLDCHQHPDNTGDDDDGGDGDDGDDVVDDRVVATLLQRQPYWESLTDAAHIAAGGRYQELPAIDAARVAAALRAPARGERACVRGARCQARQLPHSEGPLTLREWLSPLDEYEWSRSGQLPPTRAPCILCIHYLVNLAWHRRRNGDNGADDDRLLQPHYYRIDEPGEYRAAACIHPTGNDPQGLVRPFRLHDLSDFCEAPGAQPPGFRERAEVFFR